ncbi:hypothetical protein A7G45_19320 [Mycolicibacterium llatzerense]|nr:hypothetical protein [Mycolicibacterium llatzerense]
MDATVPEVIDTHCHCRQQTFYVGDDGLIGRHDFVAEPMGRRANRGPALRPASPVRCTGIPNQSAGAPAGPG